MCTHLSNTDKLLCCSIMIWSPLLREEDKSRAFSLFLCPSFKFWRDCTEDDECSCVGTQRPWFRVWRENLVQIPWYSPEAWHCTQPAFGFEGTKTHVTQAGSAEMISHATPMLTSLCVDVQHTRKSNLLVRVFTVSGKSSKRKKTIIPVWVSMS